MKNAAVFMGYMIFQLEYNFPRLFVEKKYMSIQLFCNSFVFDGALFEFP